MMRRQEIGYNPNKKVIINNQQYHITAEMYKVMKYFEQSQAIEQTDTHYINNISNQTWEKIIVILNENNYHLELPPPTIKNGNYQDYLKGRILQHLQKAQHRELNELYKASHYLKIAELRKVIGVFYACKVFFKQTKKDYSKKAEQLGVNRDDCWPSSDQLTMYKDTFPFIN